MKNVINWNYERGSWQWDLLCLLILAFIFLTPRALSGGRGSGTTQDRVEAVQTVTAPEARDK